jgi:hypothetical protein
MVAFQNKSKKKKTSSLGQQQHDIVISMVFKLFNLNIFSNKKMYTIKSILCDVIQLMSETETFRFF